MNKPCEKCYQCFGIDKYNNIQCNLREKSIPMPEFCADQLLIGHAESSHQELCNKLKNDKIEWNKKTT